MGIDRLGEGHEIECLAENIFDTIPASAQAIVTEAVFSPHHTAEIQQATPRPHLAVVQNAITKYREPMDLYKAAGGTLVGLTRYNAQQGDRLEGMESQDIESQESISTTRLLNVLSRFHRLTNAQKERIVSFGSQNLGGKIQFEPRLIGTGTEVFAIFLKPEPHPFEYRNLGHIADDLEKALEEQPDLAQEDLIITCGSDCLL